VQHRDVACRGLGDVEHGRRLRRVDTDAVRAVLVTPPNAVVAERRRLGIDATTNAGTGRGTS
jgi:hypothetical protein